MPELMRSAKLAIEKGLAQGRDLSYLKQLSDYIIPAMLEALHKVSVCSVLFFCFPSSFGFDSFLLMGLMIGFYVGA